MADIFISYAREDEERVKPIVAALEQKGWSVFWDRTIPIGQTWRSYIGKKFEEANCVLVAWSKYSVESKWVLKEAGEAESRGIFVPFKLDSVKQPFGFDDIQAADLTSWNNSRSDPQFVLLNDAIASFLSTRETVSSEFTKQKPPAKATKEKVDPSLVDIGGKEYKTVKIGSQIWMAENLNVSCYKNGDRIPQVKDPQKWSGLTEGAWCYYQNNTNNEKVYGKLYNWYAVNDPRGLAPDGWHVPSDFEWQKLEKYLGMGSEEVKKDNWRGNIGGLLKESGTKHWKEPNEGASNKSGFTALAANVRFANGLFEAKGEFGYFWSSSGSKDDDISAWARVLYYVGAEIARMECDVWCGFSVRCIKD